MGTYSNRSHMMPEASSTGSASHFAWFYPGSFFSKATSIPSQGAQINLKQALDVAPVCSVPPSADSATGNNPGTRTPSVKKQKVSTTSTNETPSKASRSKQPKKGSLKKTKLQTMPEAKRERKNLNIDIERASFDFSGVPSPFCSCTGTPRVCYKWGAGGWQSSCCTTNISEYPLPMSSTRPGARMAGRKMSNGAYVKLLMKLAAEGHDLSNPVDLKSHWARHGTNKFVTIK